MNRSNSTDLLQFAASQGIIDISYVQEALDMSIRERCLETHPYKVWQGLNGSWYTYLPDETKQKGRILKRRSTKEALEEDIIFYWQNQFDNPTVREIFEEWNDRRVELGKISKSTYSRYVWDFNRYYILFGNQHIKGISSDDVETFLDEQIVKFDLTAKAFSNLKTLTKGLLKYAKKKHLIDFPVEELFADLDVSDREFRKVIKEDYQEVFNEEETDRIIFYLEEHLDIQNLGILILFVTGMRIGELVTLRHDDLDGNTIRIRRTETVYKDNEGNYIYTVKEFPKSQAGVRTAVIPRDFSWLVDEIERTNPDCDYIFCKKGNRLTTNSIRKRLDRVCEKLDIYKKSPHKIRKTYGSILLDNNVDKRLVTELMGHTNIAVTENYYHRNRRSLDDKIDRISDIPDFQVKQK